MAGATTAMSTTIRDNDEESRSSSKSAEVVGLKLETLRPGYV